MATKNDFDLLRSLEGTSRYNLGALQLEPNLFAQLASYAFLGLLTCVNKTSGNTPTISWTKTVLEQEHAPFPIHNYGRSGDREARVGCAHGQAA